MSVAWATARDAVARLARVTLDERGGVTLYTGASYGWELEVVCFARDVGFDPAPRHPCAPMALTPTPSVAGISLRASAFVAGEAWVEYGGEPTWCLDRFPSPPFLTVPIFSRTGAAQPRPLQVRVLGPLWAARAWAALAHEVRAQTVARLACAPEGDVATLITALDVSPDAFREAVLGYLLGAP